MQANYLDSRMCSAVTTNGCSGGVDRRRCRSISVLYARRLSDNLRKIDYCSPRKFIIPVIFALWGHTISCLTEIFVKQEEVVVVGGIH